jgi:hypothetical protein
VEKARSTLNSHPEEHRKAMCLEEPALGLDPRDAGPNDGLMVRDSNSVPLRQARVMVQITKQARPAIKARAG